MDLFIEKLILTEKELLKKKKKYIKYKKVNYKDCLLCKKKNVAKGLYEINRVRWEDSGLFVIQNKVTATTGDDMDHPIKDEVIMNPIKPFVDHNGVFVFDGGLATQLEARGADFRRRIMVCVPVAGQP